MNPSTPDWGPGGSVEAQELSQFLATWERNFAERLRAKLRLCEDTPTAALIAEQLAECSDVYSRLIGSGYAREDS